MGNLFDRLTGRAERRVSQRSETPARDAPTPLSDRPPGPADELLPIKLGRALLDARWQADPSYKSMVTRHTWIVGLAVLLFLGAIASALLIPSEVISGPMVGVLAGLAVVVAYAAGLYVFWDRARRRRVFQALVAMGMAGQLQERERDLAQSGEPLSLAALWSVTQERIEYYHQIVTTQSEVSFRNGAITSYLGLGLLLTLAVVAIFAAGNLATSITIGVLGAVGAALSGYLGATFIKLHTESSAQLREFFSQPVEFSRLLGAERLIESLPPTERAESVQLVIRAMMGDD